MKRLILLGLLALFAIGATSADVLVDTSHSAAINDLAFTPDGEQLISIGDDGKLKVWDRDERSIAASWQVSPLPLVRMAVHPEDAEVALVEHDGSSRIFLSVWNWEEGEIIFRRALEELPLLFQYSPQGSYVVTTKPSFDSITLFNADNGRVRPSVEDGFGIVTYAVVSRSESNIMAYTGSNGRIRYFDLSSGREIQEARTLPDLEHLSLLPNRRYALAVREAGLVVIDVIDGEIEDSYNLSGITGLRREGDSNRYLVRRVRDGEAQLLRFTANDSNIRREFSAPVDLSEDHSAFAGYEETSYYATREGSIYSYRRNSRIRRVFARNILEAVTDIATGFQRLIVATPDRLLRFSSDIFRDPLETPRYFRYSSVDNPAGAPVLLEAAGRRDILMWKRDEPSAEIWHYDPLLGRVDTYRDPQDDAPAVRGVSAHDDGVVVLTTSGSFRDLPEEGEAATFSYEALGMEDVIRTERYGIVVGKSRTDAFSSALLLIDPETGETVPIRTDERLIFDIAPADDDALYTLGLRELGGGTETVLRRRFGRNLAAADTLLTAAGEHLDAHLIYDEDSDSTFAVIDQAAPYRISGSSRRTLPESGQLARRVNVVDQVVASANADGSVSFWSIGDNAHLADLYLFRNGEWALVTVDGRYVVPSRFDESYLRYIPSSSRDRRELRDRRIELDVR